LTPDPNGHPGILGRPGDRRRAAPRCGSTGNIKKFDDKIGEIARAAKDAGVSIRIGSTPVRWTRGCWPNTAGHLRRAGGVRAVEASLFTEHDFHDFKISVKHNDRW